MWIGVVPWLALSLGADLAWKTGVWDRSGEYGPLPLSMFVIPLWIPAAAVAVTLGILLRHRIGPPADADECPEQESNLRPTP